MTTRRKTNKVFWHMDPQVFDLHYYCPDCDFAWDDRWCSYVDSDCEGCGDTYTPFDSLEKREEAIENNIMQRAVKALKEWNKNGRRIQK